MKPKIAVININYNNYVMDELASYFTDVSEHFSIRLKKYRYFFPFFYFYFITKILISISKLDEIIFVSNSPFNLFVAIFVSNTKRTKIILHDTEFHEGENKISKFILEYIYNVLYKRDHILYIVDNEEMQRNWMRKCKQSDCKIIKLPATASIINAIPETVNTLKDMKNNYLFIYGRIEPYKGFDFLEKLANLSKDMPIFLAGKGTTEFCEGKSNMIGLGFMKASQLRYAIENCAIFIVPYSNATGTQIIPTALHLGCSVAATPLKYFECYRDRIYFYDEPEKLFNNLEYLKSLKTIDFSKDYCPTQWKHNIINCI
jgi:hypothetical protein